MVRTRQCFTLLTSECASRHNGVHFFDMSTSKSAPTLVCVCTLLLGHVLHRAPTACTFSTAQLPKVVQTCGALYILTWKCASRSTCPSKSVQTHTNVGALLEVDMSKKCTPLWREAHVEVKMLKNISFVPLSDIHDTTTTTTATTTTSTATTTVHYTTPHHTTLHYLHYTTLH